MKKLSVFGVISIAAIVSGLLIGCGGSGSSNSAPGPTISTTGGISSTTGNSTTVVPSSASPQQVQVTLGNGSTVTAMVPPGQPAFTPTSTLSIIPSGVAIINGLAPGRFQRRTSGANPVNISYNKGATWLYTGVNFDSSGTLTQNIALVAPILSGAGNNSKCYLQAVGPLALTGTVNNGAVLTIQQLIFGIVIDSLGVASLPATLTLDLPGNNGLTVPSNSASVNYPLPDYATGTATLLFTWPGIVRAQTKSVTNGAVSYEGPSNSAPVRIPSGGVTTVEYLFTQP